MFNKPYTIRPVYNPNRGRAIIARLMAALPISQADKDWIMQFPGFQHLRDYPVK
jgi:hypothetical protein